MNILKKISIKFFWISLNLFLVPIAIIYIFFLRTNLKIEKIRVFEYLNLDDGNINFSAYIGTKKVFIKVDLFGKNLKNEFLAFQYLKNKKRNFNIPEVIFFKKKVIISNFIYPAKTLDEYLIDNPNLYYQIINKVNVMLDDLLRFNFIHNDLLLKNILIKENTLYLVDFYFSSFKHSISFFKNEKNIAYGFYGHNNVDKITFNMDLSIKKIQPYSINVKKDEILSIVVLFNPDIEALERLIDVHSNNFSNTLLIDNTSGKNPYLLKKVPQSMHVIFNYKNLGLSKAYNIGINYAKIKGFRMVALFDQDTYFENNFSNIMLQNINSFFSYKMPAVYSPIYYNEVTNKMGLNIFYKFIFMIKMIPDLSVKHTFPNHVISSGSFIPLNVLDDVGNMLDELFIDLVDIEWCMRARGRGYEIVSFSAARIFHNLGHSSIKIFGKEIFIHTPLRMYYYFRNSVYLNSKKYLPLHWKIIEFFRNSLRFLFFMVFINDKKKYFRYIIKGIFDGLNRNMGIFK